MWPLFIGILSLRASVYAVRTMFLIWRPFNSSSASASSVPSAASTSELLSGVCDRNVNHSFLRLPGPSLGYLMARWMRDLKAAAGGAARGGGGGGGPAGGAGARGK